MFLALPEVYRCVARCEAVAPIKNPVDLLVIQSPELQAFTFGVGRLKVIVLTSNLVKTSRFDELTAVIAHEWGHPVLYIRCSWAFFRLCIKWSLGQSC